MESLEPGLRKITFEIPKGPFCGDPQSWIYIDCPVWPVFVSSKGPCSTSRFVGWRVTLVHSALIYVRMKRAEVHADLRCLGRPASCLCLSRAGGNGRPVMIKTPCGGNGVNEPEIKTHRSSSKHPTPRVAHCWTHQLDKGLDDPICRGHRSPRSSCRRWAGHPADVRESGKVVRLEEMRPATSVTAPYLHGIHIY